MILDKAWWNTADRTRLVPEGHPEAAFLAYPRSTEIPDATAAKLGMLGEEAAAFPEVDELASHDPYRLALEVVELRAANADLAAKNAELAAMLADLESDPTDADADEAGAAQSGAKAKPAPANKARNPAANK